MNWNQTGMPAALVGNLRQKREITEFKSVLNDAQHQVMRPVDVEQMAEELAKSGGREFVEMVRELTMALTAARTELENANRRYERLAADLERRGIGIAEPSERQRVADRPDGSSEESSPAKSKSAEDGLAEWEEWNRRFQSLLD